MNPANSRAWLISAAVCALGLVAAPTSAQITPDATLPSNSVVLPNGNVLTIEGGTEAGSNLFHSFEEFSIPTGSEAFFNNVLTIDNIITRVTGGNLSEIDGLIRANGAANLFLINPNGIQFGPNASLNIGGSFLGSTAESLLFEDGSFYSAIEPQASPLLTVNVPVGLQFSGNSGSIAVRGNGSNLTANGSFFAPIDRSEVIPNLEVKLDRTLALLGSTIHLTGSTVFAPGGHLELSSPQAGSVAFTPQGEGWTFDYTDIARWGDVRLSQQALADASGEGGSLQVRARNLEIREGSVLLRQNRGTTSTGTIRIEATDTVTIAGVNSDGRIPSAIISQTLGAGDGADIEIKADRLRILAGAEIDSTTFGSGMGGSLQANIDSELDLMGTSAFDPGQQSNIRVQTVASGGAGNLTLRAERLNILASSTISARTTGSGNGGNLTIVAESIALAENTPGSSHASIIGASSFNEGDAGNIEIETDRLTILDGSFISASALAQGDGGSVTISASESLSISGTSPDGTFSEVRAQVQLASPIVQRIFGAPAAPSGRAGNVTIETPSLRVADNAQISVANDGIGDAGTLQIRADSIHLDALGRLVANTASGEGGNIALDTGTLQLRGGSFISAEARGIGNGGNVTLDANTIALLENSSITANAFEGSGGNIQITTSGLFVSPDSRITASSQFGVDGTVAVNNPIVDPASGLVVFDGDTLNPNSQIQDSCDIATRSRFTFTGNGGLPEDPTDFFRGQTVWRDTRLGEIDSNLIPNPTEVEPEEAATPTEPLVEATGWKRNNDGQVELIVASGNPSHSPWQPHPECNSVSQESDGVESSER